MTSRVTRMVTGTTSEVLHNGTTKIKNNEADDVARTNTSSKVRLSKISATIPPAIDGIPESERRKTMKQRKYGTRDQKKAQMGNPSILTKCMYPCSTRAAAAMTTAIAIWPSRLVMRS